MADQPARGEFSFKATAVTIIPGQTADSILSQVNFEGPVTPGLGMCFATSIHDFGGTTKGGIFTLCEKIFAEDGRVINSKGHGILEEIGKHRWRTIGIIMNLDDGRRFHIEGEMDAGERTWRGTWREIE